jgi:hypothetical protein
MGSPGLSSFQAWDSRIICGVPSTFFRAPAYRGRALKTYRAIPDDAHAVNVRLPTPVRFASMSWVSVHFLQR